MSYRTIQIAGGHEVLVSECDFENVSSRHWCAKRLKHTIYAESWMPAGETNLLMHRFLLNAGPGQWVDHINHNGLDNRRENIRLCSPAQNQWNMQPFKGCSSKFKGVSSRRGKWDARISVNGKTAWLRTYRDEVLAARAYDVQAAHYFGEFAFLNFPESLNESRRLYAAAEAERDEQKRTVGVNWHPGSQQWQVSYHVNGQRKYGGLYPTVEEAVAARELLLQSQEVA